MAVLPTGIGPVTGGYQIERSLRFNSADSAYLNRTPASAGNRTTWTWSGWVKRGALGSVQPLFMAGAAAADYTALFFNSTDTLCFHNVASSANAGRKFSSAVYRDPAAWYHIVAVWDTTNATASNRMLVYVNGVPLTAFSPDENPSSSQVGQINNNVIHTISKNSTAAVQYIDGYLTEINFVDGQALTPSSFGETDTNTGVWKPKAYSGTYGTNGFFLKFADNSGTTSTTLGKDSSGNGNNWTPNNFSVTAGAGNDSLVDSPTAYGTDTGVGGEVRGNYCTWNPLKNSTTLSDGNLRSFNSSTTQWLGVVGTFGMTSGKWYWEYTPTVAATVIVGLANSSYSTGGHPGSDANSWGYYSANGQKYFNNSGSAYGATYTANDVIGVAFDADAGTLTFYKNGVSQGTAYSSLTSGPYFPAVGVLNSQILFINAGQRAFAYTAPSGFKALCTTNLPTPTIGATSTTQANKYFTPYLYTADGTSPKSRTGIGFAPDFLWFKSRSTTFSHALYDQVRGTNKGLQTNTTAAENTYTLLSTFGSDGFTTTTDGTVGNILNDSTNTYVTWCWNAGGSNATNTSGTITSTVRANTTSGFSIVTYTGTGANATVGHGLGVAPSMVIVKKRSASENWVVYHTSIGATKYLVLNLTNAEATSATRWNDTAPTSTVFSIGTSGNVNDNTGTYVAYCFAPVAGYSAFGSYTGNGSTDGPFVYLGFRARWILIKSTGASEEHWMLYDTARNTYNVSNTFLMPSASNAELTTRTIDINSNGFKVRDSDTKLNTNAEKYIYAAFAETPFRYSLAR